MEPLVSVVISVYNGEKHLKGAIESVLLQSFCDFELLVLDDASTDGSLEIIRAFAQQDSRIKLIRNKINLGLTRSLNMGISQAKGRYIARQDADDLSQPDRLEKLVAYLEQHPECALVASNVSAIDEEGRLEKYFRYSVKDLKAKLLRGNHFTHGSVCFVKQAFHEIGGYREAFKYAQDYDLFSRMAEKYEIAYLPDYLYHWRNSPLGISNRKFIDQLQLAILIRCFIRERRQEGRDSYSAMIELGFDHFIEKYRYRDYFNYNYGRALFSINEFKAARESFSRVKGFPQKYLLLVLSFLGKDIFEYLRKIRQMRFCPEHRSML